MFLGILTWLKLLMAGITDKIVTFFCLLDKKRAEKFPVAEIGGKDTIGGTGWK